MHDAQNIENGPSVDILSSAEYQHHNIKDLKTEVSPQNTMNKSCACGKKEGCSCGSEDSKMAPHPLYVYAIGKVVHRFPNRSLEMELAQAIGRRPEGETKGVSHPEVAHKVLTDPNNRYIARQICYVLTIEGLETYILSSK